MLFCNSLQIQEIMIPVSQLPQEGGKFILHGLNFAYCRKFMSFFIILKKKNYKERKGGLFHSQPPSLVLGCTQNGFSLKLKNNLKFLKLCVTMN